uniref:Uncharacterized protein n=1 Tax=Globisporangium ultimum (strain ATCC 200006 / CBS 805.95 / DAOM BR144) TaxID=431595 RepID=K3X181_GLOUD
MELRNRNVGGRRDVDGRLHDVSLGPTIYAGERYSKMSERLKRQKKNAVDVEGTANRLLAPRFIGFVVAMAMVLILFLFLQYQASRKRNKYKGV